MRDLSTPGGTGAVPQALSELSERLKTVAAVGTPEEVISAAATLLEETLASHVAVHWRGEWPEWPDEEGAPATVHVRRDGAELAALVMGSERALSGEEHALLTNVGNYLDLYVDLAGARSERRAEEKLEAALEANTDPFEMTALAVETATKSVGADAGLLLLERPGRFCILAETGDWLTSEERAAGGSLPLRLIDDAALAARGAAPTFTSERVLGVGISARPPARTTLLLRFANKPASIGAVRIAKRLARVWGNKVEAIWRSRAVAEISAVTAAPRSATTACMYESLMRAALNFVPGADYITLHVREGADEPFRLAAASGQDVSHMATLPMPELMLRSWYGRDNPGWEEGKPRIINRLEHDIATFMTLGRELRQLRPHLYLKLECNLCLPIVLNGEVLGILSLSNEHDPTAFGPDSLELVSLLAPAVAALIQSDRERIPSRPSERNKPENGALMGAAEFMAALDRAIRSAAGRGQGPCILVIGLPPQPAIDANLYSVIPRELLAKATAALRSTVRKGELFTHEQRGEHLVLLARENLAAGEATRNRAKQLLGDLRMGRSALKISVGVAEHRAGETATELLKRAREAMIGDRAEFQPPESSAGTAD